MQNQSIYLLAAYTSDGRDHRTWGWLPTLPEAEMYVTRNILGMDDNMFDYLVIERVKKGVSATSEAVQWYEFTDKMDEHGNNEWEKCEPPVWTDQTSNFTIG